MQTNHVKTKRVHNLIIVDESGSMSGLTQVTLSGVNEIISTIREAQNKYADVQQHYITLVTFDERNDNKVLPIRTI
jgi:Mg2+/Co2+ transporter CorC